MNCVSVRGCQSVPCWHQGSQQAAMAVGATEHSGWPVTAPCVACEGLQSLTRVWTLRIKDFIDSDCKEGRAVAPKSMQSVRPERLGGGLRWELATAWSGGSNSGLLLYSVASPPPLCQTLRPAWSTTPQDLPSEASVMDHC